MNRWISDDVGIQSTGAICLQTSNQRHNYHRNFRAIIQHR